jgi:hypothetical protein
MDAGMISAADDDGLVAFVSAEIKILPLKWKHTFQCAWCSNNEESVRMAVAYANIVTGLLSRGKSSKRGFSQNPRGLVLFTRHDFT